MPKFSIVIPSFNGKTYIGECVKSALSQSYEDIEVVVDDNASTDGTVQMLEKQFGADPRLRVIANKEDLNIPLGWNRGISNAKGEYLLLLHSDNVLHPNYASKIIPLMEEYSASVAYTECEYFEGATPESLFASVDQWTPFSLLSPGSRAVAYMFRFQRMIPTSGTTIRKEALSGRAFYDPRYRWDPDMEQMAFLAEKFGVIHVPQKLAAIRTHKEQARGWKDPNFSSEYKELLENQHRVGRTERTHYYTQWAYSNQDLTVRLAEFGAPTSSFFKFWSRWFLSENTLFLHGFANWLVKMNALMRALLTWALTHTKKAFDFPFLTKAPSKQT